MLFKLTEWQQLCQLSNTKQTEQIEITERAEAHAQTKCKNKKLPENTNYRFDKSDSNN